MIGAVTYQGGSRMFLMAEDTNPVSHPVLAQIMTYSIVVIVALFLLVGLGRAVGLTLADRRKKENKKTKEE
ncbi:hypothetical protein MJA45_06985 [Paenibacillus aurantius]|uniref:Uncharacterized protein n=1 Tax=Paenibacillus aurantius TaxID=2918900 RepID=A0AA96LFF3_9BACL|nr:hypothetical protein [Paenibacillus aurantius]WNQ12771.1 hypothetical protein MJA45_06985 [Paenibacillus aurantius]